MFLNGNIRRERIAARPNVPGREYMCGKDVTFPQKIPIGNIM